MHILVIYAPLLGGYVEFQARIFPASPFSPHYLTAETHKLQWEAIPLTGDELHLAVKKSRLSRPKRGQDQITQNYASIQVHPTAKEALMARVVRGVRTALLMLERYV